ncbi:hypothetical protein HJ590_03700 [Naumannella sp. ID2617S]|uniref:Uncharacterized protein n=1 Tax=Enemella dayhoffiae TaxID=2016507 RepID=A0A255H692_9ACTN|nr:hypothetical protein [Enemella dayhoffiae]NNG18688.1 hypothetical protein [Naumannella sp. ID2617S]OYO23107.1 hypothetical protein CGZ93_06505 [Enemella dayhoffiae]
MDTLAAVRLTAHLNALRHTPLSAEVAARAVVGEDAAHHVTDPEGLLGLDPLRASELDEALRAALLLVDADWVLVLPRPGATGVLAGPPALNAAAIEAGAVVLSASGGIAWLPHRVGPAVQWQVTACRPPRLSQTPAEADRALREVVLAAGRELAELELTPAERPDLTGIALPAGYGSRAQRAAARAWTLLQACEAALGDDGGVLHLHALQARSRVLNEVRRAATDVLCAAVSWTGRQG